MFITDIFYNLNLYYKSIINQKIGDVVTNMFIYITLSFHKQHIKLFVKRLRQRRYVDWTNHRKI